jgi:hypothetical protein
MTTAAAVSGTELVRLEEPLLSPDEQAAQGRPSRVSCPRSPPRGPHRDLLNELETRIHDDGRCATDLPVRTVALAIPKRRTVNVTRCWPPRSTPRAIARSSACTSPAPASRRCAIARYCSRMTVRAAGDKINAPIVSRFALRPRS